MADLQDVCNLLKQIRDALYARGVAEQPAPMEEAIGDGPTVTPQGLKIDSSARLAYWNGRRIPINGHADFSVLTRLADGAGALVSYQALERAICPAAFGESVSRNFDAIAPQDVKDAIQHIRSAFRQACCPLHLENVRQKGYRLINPTNNLHSSISTTSMCSEDEVEVSE